MPCSRYSCGEKGGTRASLSVPGLVLIRFAGSFSTRFAGGLTLPTIVDSIRDSALSRLFVSGSVRGIFIKSTEVPYLRCSKTAKTKPWRPLTTAPSARPRPHPRSLGAWLILWSAAQTPPRANRSPHDGPRQLSGLAARERAEQREGGRCADSDKPLGFF